MVHPLFLLHLRNVVRCTLAVAAPERRVQTSRTSRPSLLRLAQTPTGAKEHANSIKTPGRQSKSLSVWMMEGTKVHSNLKIQDPSHSWEMLEMLLLCLTKPFSPPVPEPRSAAPSFHLVGLVLAHHLLGRQTSPGARARNGDRGGPGPAPERADREGSKNAMERRRRNPRAGC